MANLPKLILSELNSARTNPRIYANKIQATLKYYKGNIYEKPGYVSLETE